MSTDPSLFTLSATIFRNKFLGVIWRARASVLTMSIAFGNPTTPTVDAGARGPLITGVDLRRAQTETNKQSTKVSPTITSPRSRSVRRIRIGLPSSGATGC